MFFTSSPENTLSASLVMSVFLAELSPPAKFYHTSKARYVTFGCQNAITRAFHCCARHLSTSASFWWLHTFLYVSIVIGVMLVSPMIFTPPVNTFGGMAPITFFVRAIFSQHRSDHIRLPREPWKCRITQDIFCRKKCLECSTAWCHARERHFAWRRRDK